MTRADGPTSAPLTVQMFVATCESFVHPDNAFRDRVALDRPRGRDGCDQDVDDVE